MMSRDINKLINHKKKEIILYVFIIIFTFFMWDNIFINDLNIANAYEKTSYAYVDKSKYEKYFYDVIDEDSFLNNENKNTISLLKDTTLDTKYTLGIRVNKISTIDYHDMKVKIDDNIYNLSDFYINEDSNYYYFHLVSGNMTTIKVSYDISFYRYKGQKGFETFFIEFMNFDNLFA